MTAVIRLDTRLRYLTPRLSPESSANGMTLCHRHNHHLSITGPGVRRVSCCLLRINQLEFTMNTINPQYAMARRRAERRAAKFSQPHLAYPAYQRRELASAGPKVDIGILRDPALPIEIHPAIHTPPKRGWAWQEYATTAVCAVSLVAITSILSLGY